MASFYTSIEEPMKQGYMVCLYLLMVVLSIGSAIYWHGRQHAWWDAINLTMILLWGIMFVSEYFDWIQRKKS